MRQLSRTFFGVLPVFLAKTSRRDDRVVLEGVDDPLAEALVHDAKLVAGASERRHRARVWKREGIPQLQPFEEETGLASRLS